MTPFRTFTLTERRTVVRRVPRADAAEVATRFGHAIEVQPAAERGAYCLTARGYVGWFSTSTVRWVIRPKLPWANLTRMISGSELRVLHQSPPKALGGLCTAFADLITARLAELMRERAVAGLLYGYRERATESAEVRGRIDFAEQARRHSPGGPFAVVADEFTPDVTWNRIPVAAARILLDRPELSTTIRGELTRVLATFADVDDSSPAAEMWDRLCFDARTEPYRRLIDWCRLVLASTGPGETGGGLLLNLEYLFQTRVGTVLASPRVQAQAAFTLEPVRGSVAPVLLRPDFLVTDNEDTPAAVWDAKWKSLSAAGPDPSDAQQVLAYAAALGVRTAGLVYPGRSFAVREFLAPSGVRLFAVRLNLNGPTDRFRRLVFER